MKANAGEVYTVYNQYLKRYTACQVAYIAPPDTVSKESWAVVLSLDWVGDAPLTAEELPHLRPLYSPCHWGHSPSTGYPFHRRRTAGRDRVEDAPCQTGPAPHS